MASEAQKKAKQMAADAQKRVQDFVQEQNLEDKTKRAAKEAQLKMQETWDGMSPLHVCSACALGDDHESARVAGVVALNYWLLLPAWLPT